MCFVVVGDVTAMNEERSKIEDAKQLGQVIADVRNLTKSVDKLENTVTDFGDRLDNLAKDLGTLLGTQNSIISMQRQINHIESWVDGNKEYIATLKEESKDTKGRIKDFIFSYVLPNLITGAMIFFVLQWKQHEAINEIISKLK